jgi:hypothetical protein
MIKSLTPPQTFIILAKIKEIIMDPRGNKENISPITPKEMSRLKAMTGKMLKGME